MDLNKAGVHLMTFCHGWGDHKLWVGAPPLGCVSPLPRSRGVSGKAGSVPFAKQKYKKAQKDPGKNFFIKKRLIHYETKITNRR